MKKLFRKVLPALLAVILFLNPILGMKILAQEMPSPTPVPAVESVAENSDSPEPSPTPQSQEGLVSEPTPTESETASQITPTNEAAATETSDTAVTNNDQADVDNNINSEANTGGNEIIVSPTPAPTGTEELVEQIPTPTEILATPTQTESFAEGTPTPTEGVMVPTPDESLQIGQSTPTPIEILPDQLVTLTLMPSPLPTDEAAPDASNTGVEEPVDFSDSSQQDTVSVTNNNDATVDNSTQASGETGGNSEEGKRSEIETEDAVANADVANFVNTNLVGADFWQLIINMFSTSDNDIDLTKIEGYQSLDPALVSVLAKNDNTGDGSVNIALANILSSYVILNNNTASVTNDVTVSANTGDNQIDGKRSEIETGDATASANVFNLVNTNLVGNDWFFGIINLFKQQNGDIILPYELQYLLEGGEGEFGGVAAINQGTGDGSQNQAQASLVDSTTITNNNQADVDNNINVGSNTGNNTIIGEDSSIKTGNAQALVDLINIVNTNIYGSHWLLLAINNFGNWTGDILGWWGNKLTIGNTTYIWIKLPDELSANNQGQVAAVNCQTGDDSQNYAIASQTTSFEVINNNQAVVENNITVTADTGNNQIDGKHSNIETGEAKASANIANIVNTNIIGNNWFFGVINIFDNFFGNIIFPRPDLVLMKAVNKQSANPAEEVTYRISYQDAGRLWAKNVVVEDILPAGVAFVSAGNGGTFENGKIIWKFEKIDSKSSGSLEVVVKVNNDVSDGTTISNCASISTSTNEPNKENNQSCADTLIGQNPPGPTPTPTGQPEPTVTPIATATPTPQGGDDGGENNNGGVGGQPEGSGSSSSGGGGSSSCTYPNAPEAPVLLSAERLSSTEVKLTWTKIDRANNYLISYGLSSGNYIYGNPNVGDVLSYIVGSLDPQTGYYFVVAAGISGDCSVAGANSNELFAGPFYTVGILGDQDTWGTGNVGLGDDLEGGISTEAGLVEGAKAKGACPFWWIVLAGQTVLLAGFYAFLLKRGKLPKRWWIVVPALAATAYLVDRYAHTHWYSPSTYCRYEPWLSALAVTIETTGFKLLRKRN